MARGERNRIKLVKQEKKLISTIKLIHNTKFIFPYAIKLADKLLDNINSLPKQPKNFLDNLFNKNLILEYQEEIEQEDSRKEKIEYKVFQDSQPLPNGNLKQDIHIIISDSHFEKPYYFEYYNSILVGLRSPPKKQIPKD